MKPYQTIILALFFIAFAASSSLPKNNTVTGFEKIRSLIGEWDGTLPDGKPIKISYQEISGGAIVEIYHSQDPMWWNMSSAYHRDKEKIMLTHFCSWGNHPRMAAIVPTGAIKRLEFDFIDITKTQPQNGYMRNVAFEFKSEDHILHHWLWQEQDKQVPLTLTLKRKKVKPELK